jgi:hypothetical protein
VFFELFVIVKLITNVQKREFLAPSLVRWVHCVMHFQTHCTENSKQIFPGMKLHSLVHNSYIHVSVSDLYIPTSGPPTLPQFCNEYIIGPCLQCRKKGPKANQDMCNI